MSTESVFFLFVLFFKMTDNPVAKPRQTAAGSIGSRMEVCERAAGGTEGERWERDEECLGLTHT